MRNIISISLQENSVKHLRNTAKKRGFKSVSAYVRYVLKNDDEVISEKELVRNVKESRKEYKKGKSIRSKTIADLV